MSLGGNSVRLLPTPLVPIFLEALLLPLLLLLLSNHVLSGAENLARLDKWDQQAPLFCLHSELSRRGMRDTLAIFFNDDGQRIKEI